MDILKPVSIRQIAFASFIGTTVEWYDFMVYGTAAALVFPKLFFPNFSPLAGTLASFATFGVAFFGRPAGGVVFGHFGDHVGRKAMLVITLLVMGAATFLIGLLPTFQQVGILAPILLAVLRFLQGFAVGGEWGGATLMTVEHAPEKSRCFHASWPQLGVPMALILATAVFSAFSALPDQQFLAWGWRAPFLLSFVLIGAGLFVRLRLPESPAFARVKELGAESKLPALDLLRDYPLSAILAIGAPLANITSFYIITTFSLSYATTQLGLARSVPLTGYLLAGAVEIPVILIFARIADRAGARPVALWSSWGILLFCYPYFWLLDTRQPALIWLAMMAWMCVGSALHGVTGIFLAQLFPARMRYSGISIGYQAAGMLGGALAPFIATALIHWSGGASWPVATYMAILSVISLVAVGLASEKRRVEIHDQEAAGVRGK